MTMNVQSTQLLVPTSKSLSFGKGPTKDQTFRIGETGLCSVGRDDEQEQTTSLCSATRTQVRVLWGPAKTRIALYIAFLAGWAVRVCFRKQGVGASVYVLA